MSMGLERYRVRVTKDHLVFAAAHFITIGPDFCERIHGHNWRVAVEVAGPLDENRYVFDFIALRDAVQQIVNELDHRMLLPAEHPQLTVAMTEREVEVRYRDRRWVFPKEECYVLPVAQTTAELIARWMGERLLARLPDSGGALESLCVQIEENFGQWASCELRVQRDR